MIHIEETYIILLCEPVVTIYTGDCDVSNKCAIRSKYFNEKQFFIVHLSEQKGKKQKITK